MWVGQFSQKWMFHECWIICLFECMARFIANHKMALSGTDGPECFNYMLIDDDSRRVGSKYTHDRPDGDLAEGWYRFINKKRMWNSCIPSYECNVMYPGWLEGAHPSVWQGRVTRKVCFGRKWISSTCCNYNTQITVRNCGSFYVYKLKPTPAGSLRYCTN